jgi:dUTP pyrophosphatase
VSKAQVKIVKMAPDVQLPMYATEGSAGADVRVYAPNGSLFVGDGEICKIPTGLKFEIPRGKALLILPRSGLSNTFVRIANAPGLLDEDFRGELFVSLHNQRDDPLVLVNGERIAQLVLIDYYHMEFTEVESFDTITERGEGGFGSTGSN